MNLATRCSACGTLFRVVQDQLKVSDGWVRCGRCHAVFDAQAGLVDVDREPAPSDAVPDPSVKADGSGAGGAHGTPTAFEPERSPAARGSRGPDHDADRIDASDPPLGEATIGSEAGFDAPFDLVLPEHEPAASAHGPTFDIAAKTDTDRALASTPLPAWAASAAPADGGPTAATAEPLTADEPPLFARPTYGTPTRARHTGRWAAAAASLALLLGVQVLYQERDLVAARWPALAPALASACGAVGCRLEPPRRIDDLAVDNTGLTLTALAGAYRLTVGLRNRSTIPIATPAIELALTDGAGQLLARRVLATTDFDKAPAAIAAGGELLLQALLATPGARVSGYTVEVFYP